MPDAGFYGSFFRDAPELFVVLGPNRKVMAANPAFRATVRHGRDGVDFMDVVAPTARDRILGGLVRAAAGDEVHLRIPHVQADGKERVVDYGFFPVEGGLVAGIGRLRPEGEPAEALHRAEEELKEKSRILDEISLELTQVPFIDPVTGVWNRLQVIERLTSEWSRCERYASPLSCLMVEVEGLAEIRARDGGVVGDEILKAVARRLKAVVRDHDVVGRYGGDRFVVLAVQSDREGASSLCTRIRAAVTQEPVSVTGRTFDVEIRIGGATNRSDGVEILEDLFAVATTALEDARREQAVVHLADE